jgi:hypothetical protein
MEEIIMKNKMLFSAAVIMSLSLSSSFACDIHGNTGFMPKNNRWISKEDKETNGMTQEKFNAIIERVEAVYKPIVAAKGGNYIVVRNWDDGTVNAYADRNDGNWNVNMFGGLARSPEVTDDGFMLVVCHETGHHLGGAPRYSGNWAANEGQADYFGTLKCMRRVLGNDDNVSIVSKMNIDQEVKDKCQLVYKSDSEVALCERIAMAGKSLALLLADLGGSGSVAFTTPDKSVVKKTFDAHPQAQCRLDTYFQGGLCDKSVDEENSATDPKPGTCVKSEGFTVGTRPLCWYKPAKGE